MPRPRFTARYDLTPIFLEVARRGWSRELFAKRAGLSRPTVQKAEEGHWVTDLTVAKLAEAVGRTREEFIVGYADEGEPIAPPSLERKEPANV